MGSSSEEGGRGWYGMQRWSAVDYCLCAIFNAAVCKRNWGNISFTNGQWLTNYLRVCCVCVCVCSSELMALLASGAEH